MMDRTKQNGRHLPTPPPKFLKTESWNSRKFPKMQFRLLEFRVLFCHSIFQDFGIFCVILSFRILVIFHHSAFYDFDSLCHLIMGDQHSFIHSFIQICQHGKFAFYYSQGKGSLCFHCLEITGKRCKKIKRKKNQVMVN